MQRTYLACLQEVDVVLPDVVAVFVLTSVRQREIVALSDHLAGVGTGRDSPGRVQMSTTRARGGLRPHLIYVK